MGLDLNISMAFCRHSASMVLAEERGFGCRHDAGAFWVEIEIPLEGMEGAELGL